MRKTDALMNQATTAGLNFSSLLIFYVGGISWPIYLNITNYIKHKIKQSYSLNVRTWALTTVQAKIKLI